jgi:hypothetical protein
MLSTLQHPERVSLWQDEPWKTVIIHAHVVFLATPAGISIEYWTPKPDPPDNILGSPLSLSSVMGQEDNPLISQAYRNPFEVWRLLLES